MRPFDPHVTASITLSFAKLLWSRKSKETFWCLNHAATRPFVYHTRMRLRSVSYNDEPQQESGGYQFLYIFWLTRPEIEFKCTISLADALSTRPLNPP